MKTISIISLKGGTGKTTTAVNMAHILAVTHGKRVLLIDADKQGNASAAFGLFDDEASGIAEVLTGLNESIRDVIKPTKYAGLDMITANMNLYMADRLLYEDKNREQQSVLTEALKAVAGDYDYCVIDNAPAVDMAAINALVAANDVIVPVKLDSFSISGLYRLAEQFDVARQFNPNMCFRGCLITMYRNNPVNIQGRALLKENTDYPVFKTAIRWSPKVDESTFAGPIMEYSRGSAAAKDYLQMVAEYLDNQNVSDSDT